MARISNGFVGSFATIEDLTSKFLPSEYAGCSANIGLVAPTAKVWSDGISWAPAAGGMSAGWILAGAIGDSTTAGGLQSSIGTTVQVGNDYTATYPPQAIGGERGGSASWFTHLCLLSGGRIIANHNGGVASDTSQGCLNRLDYEISQSPSVLFMQMGITNDIQGGVATSTSKANVATAVQRVRAAGIQPVLVTVYPHNTSAFGIAARAWNEWLKYYGQQNRIPVLDTFQAVVDPASTTGNWLAAYTSDGTHATVIGAQVAGASALAQLVLHGIVPPSTDPTKFPRLANAQFGGTALEAPGQLIKNGIFKVDGNADGIADSWAAVVGTKTINTSPGAGIIGNSQKIDITTGQTGKLEQDVTVVENRRYAFTGLFKTSGCQAGGVTYSIGSALTFGSPQRQHIVAQNMLGVDYTNWTPFYFEFVTQPGATLCRVSMYTMPIAATGNCSFEFAMARMIDLDGL